MTRIQFNNADFKTIGSLVEELFEKESSNKFFPPVNIEENTDQFNVSLMVPGRKKEDFKIALDKNLLTVSFDQKNEPEVENKKMIKKEFTIKSFSRSFTLNDQVDQNAISASYENGLLILSIPKKEEVKNAPKEIAVQ